MTDPVLWVCTINDHGSFRRMLDGIHTVLGSVQLHGHLRDSDDEDGFEGISVGSTDPCMVCAVQAQYRTPCVRVAPHKFSTSFKIDLDAASTVLRRIPDDSVVQYAQFQGRSELTYTDPSGKKNGSVFVLTHNVGAEESDVGLRGITTAHSVEVPLAGHSGLREIIGSARKLGASETTFSVRDGLLQLSYTNSAGVRGTETLGSIDMQDVAYQGRFNTQYLYRFCKGVDFPKVILGMKDGCPLVLTYSFGIEDTYLRFVLAPFSDTAEPMQA